MDANTFIGLSKHTAQDRAEKMNVIFRLISSDGVPFFSYPEDKRDDRVCVEIMGGKVVKATIQ